MKAEKDLKEIFRKLDFNRDKLQDYLKWVQDKDKIVNLSTFNEYKLIKEKSPSQSRRQNININYRTRY